MEWDWKTIGKLLPTATEQTLHMVGLATVFTVLIGLPLGVVLYMTSRGGLWANRYVNGILGFVVNIGRSLPFIILMIAIIPFTRLVVGTSLGPSAAVVPLSVGAIPFFARLVETSLREIDRGKIDAAIVMGSSYRQIITKVLVRESLPGIIAGLTTSVIALISYSAMAGTIGGGGLGFLAKSRGYDRFQTDVMIATVVVIIIIVQLVQIIGDVLARKLNHR
ncbi:ABC transporter permease [Nakamurella silvestris]|nr:ABC transporter permease [Nakamurella silvestris]